MDNTYIYYLNDTVKQLIELAKDVKENDEYSQGVRFGYYSSISMILNQAEAFNIIDQLDIDIQKFIPESILGM